MGRAVYVARPISHWVVAVQVLVIIASAGVVVICTGVGIVGPARITGANEIGGRESRTTISVTGTVATTGVVGIVGT